MFKVTVKPDGSEPFDVEVTTRDALRWERAKKGRSLAQFGENPRVEDLYSLTFVAVMRSEKFPGDIREFEEQCDLERHPDSDDEDEDQDGDEDRPTRPAH
jgi:hypothetical protein